MLARMSNRLAIRDKAGAKEILRFAQDNKGVGREITEAAVLNLFAFGAAGESLS